MDRVHERFIFGSSSAVIERESSCRKRAWGHRIQQRQRWKLAGCCCNGGPGSGVIITNELDFDVVDCLARVGKQDQDAARSLVEYLYPMVISIVRKNLPRRAVEEDLAQDIFLKMFEKLDQYKGQVPLNHWVSRIAVNQCLNAIRAQGVRPEWRMADLSEEQAAALDAVTTGDSEESHPADLIAARELVDMLLESLSPEDRVVIRMLEIEDCSIEEVHRRTGWSAAYIRVRAFRARQKLNKRFGQLRKEGGL